MLDIYEELCMGCRKRIRKEEWVRYKIPSDHGDLLLNICPYCGAMKLVGSLENLREKIKLLEDT